MVNVGRQDTIDHVVDKMWEAEAASRALGICVERVGLGTARVSMEVTPAMTSGQGFCHGGVIATLADTAFAFAANSHGILTIASGFQIEFLEPASPGDTLIAEARELSVRGRTSLFDVTVYRGSTIIAQFRGRNRSLARPILEDNHG